jgi:hypothetical protein
MTSPFGLAIDLALRIALQQKRGSIIQNARQCGSSSKLRGAGVTQVAWRSWKRDVSRAFERPGTGRIAVKVIHHLGDEVLKVFRGR